VLPRLGAVAVVVLALGGLAAWHRVAPAAAASALLKPARRVTTTAPPDGCAETSFVGDNVVLKGWRCGGTDATRATLILLHGIADNRASWRGAIARFTRQRFEVIAYDSRAHGESDGDWCTYGYFEKHDLHRVIDVVGRRPVVLFGTSLGAAIGLQAAAGEPRVSGVIAAETYSDLRTVAVERAPFFLTAAVIRRAFRIAEARGAFSIDEVSPVRDAPRISAPVLLIHGAADAETPPDHSRRVYAALGGPKRLILVPHAGHNQSLGGEATWREIDRWLEERLADHTAAPSGPNRPAK
jgi:uncharacterized protein